MRYSYHGEYLDHDFIDGTQADFYAWKKTGSNYYGQMTLVGPNGLVYHLDDYAVNISLLSTKIENIIYGDDTDPYIDDIDPDDGDTNVDPSIDITGVIADDNWGVDESTVTVEVSVPGKGVIAGDLDFDGNMLELEYEFDPTDDLPLDTVVTVVVNADDLASPPNSLPEYTYSFTTATSDIETVSLGELKAEFK